LDKSEKIKAAGFVCLRLLLCLVFYVSTALADKSGLAIIKPKKTAKKGMCRRQHRFVPKIKILIFLKYWIEVVKHF